LGVEGVGRKDDVIADYKHNPIKLPSYCSVLLGVGGTGDCLAEMILLDKLK